MKLELEKYKLELVDESTEILASTISDGIFTLDNVKTENPKSAYQDKAFLIFLVAMMLFGIVLIFECVYFWQIGLVPWGLTRPVFHLKYDYLEFITCLPEPMMYGILALMTIAAVCIAIGWKARWALLTYFLGFTYFFLIEVSLYNNHYYLFILLIA